MLGILDQILCWIKQLAALVASGGVAALNAILAGLIGLLNALIAAWPIGMPDLPTPPDALLTAYGWFQWGPIGVVTDACLALLAFLLVVYLAIVVIKPLAKYVGFFE